MISCEARQQATTHSYTIFAKRITSPHLEGYWVYAQINRGDRDGKIYRQTFQHYFIDGDGQLRSRAYKLEPQP